MHRSVGTSSLTKKKKNEYTHKPKPDFCLMLQTQFDFDHFSCFSNQKNDDDASRVRVKSVFELYFYRVILVNLCSQKTGKSTNYICLSNPVNY